MKTIILKKILIIAVFSIAFHFVNAQEKYSAIVSQDGTLSFKIIAGDCYFYISQSGKISSFGSNVAGNISYNAYGNVESIGKTNISYDAFSNINAVGNINISYDANQRVESIGSINISYNAYEKIANFATENISYNAYNKVDRIGLANISYNAYGNVSEINDREGFVIFKPKMASDETN